MGISIVIPLYNKEKYIVNTIQKVLRQTYQEFEIVVVNDGSTDNSEELVKSINDYRIKIYTQKNQGAASARNLGVSLATNEWVAFLDADDEWEIEYLETISKMICKYKEAVLVGTNYRIVENNQEVVLEYPDIIDEEGVLQNYFVSGKIYTPLWTSAVAVKKTVFLELGGFPIECKTCEDVDLWCRIALRGQIVYVNIPLAIYNRDTEGMLSKTSNTSCYYPFLDDYKRYIKATDSRIDAIKEYVVYRKMVAASFQLFNILDKKQAKKTLKKIEPVAGYRMKYVFLRFASNMPIVVLKFYVDRIRKRIHYCKMLITNKL